MLPFVNGNWTAPRNREAWHEIGHVAVAFYLAGHVSVCKLGQAGQPARTVSVSTGPIPQTAEEWLAVIAFDHGGRAAVRWAIDHGKLPAVPEAESNHGDHGFYGGGGGTDHVQAWQNANKVPGWERQAAYDEGFRRARACIADNIAKIEPLVARLIAQGAVSGDEVKAALS